MEAPAIMDCPLCSHSAPEGAVECASCGAIFAKLKARAERNKIAAAQAPEPAPALNPRSLRIAAISLVVCWMLGLAIYYHFAMNNQNRPRARLNLEGRSSVSVRDSSGASIKVPVYTARSGPARQEAAPPVEPADSKPDPFDE